MKSTWKFLPKQQRNVIDLIDVATMDLALKKGCFNNFIQIYDLLSKLYHEGHQLNVDQKDVLLFPYKKWGTQAGRLLYEMRKDLWAQIRADRDEQ